jgi:hypothetical protein
MARAADLLGMERKQAETIRDLDRGQFLALGPAVCRRPVSVRIGAVRTSTRGGGQSLMPLPIAQGEELQAKLFAVDAPELPMSPPAPPPPPASDDIIEQVVAHAVQEVVDAGMSHEGAAIEDIVVEVLADMVADRECAFQPVSALYQDFTVRCRMRKLPRAPLDLAAFRRRLAMAVAGIVDERAPEWRNVVALAGRIPEDMLTPFLMIACAATSGAPCPTDEDFARAYGTSSPGRVRRLIEHMERNGFIVVRTDFGGRRSIGVPDLGVTTAASEE